MNISIMRFITVLYLLLLSSGAQAWTGEIPVAFDTNPDPDIFETTLIASRTDKEIKGTGTTPAQMYTFNGISPGPEIRVKAGDRVILHVFNNLPAGEDIVIHSHGIELNNSMDGTPVTQDNIPSGGSFDYDYIAPRAGTFWYHSHASTSDRTFKGLYGPLIVTEPAEDILRAEGVLPSDDNTYTLVLSDTTMCEDVSFTDPDLIQSACLGKEPGFVPPIQPVFNCRTTSGDCLVREGKTVLSNGRVVQAGDMLDVAANQPVRFRIINTSTTRYFRLVQPASGPLLRIGGEGGLLNNVVVDPVMLPVPGLATTGDILLAPAERADIVITPQLSDVGAVITILSDLPPPGNYKSGNSTNSELSIAPVLQLNVLAAQTPDSSLSVSDALLTHPVVNKPLEDFSVIPAADLGQLLNPASFGMPGSGDSLITLNISGTDISGDKGPAIDGVRGRFMNVGGFESVPHIASSRFGILGDVLELSVTNTTGADHVFHLHGNSFQVTNIYDGTNNIAVPVEFIDTVNVPKSNVVTFRVRLEDKPQIIDNIFEPYGGLGRWLFHCHITTHAELGMISELAVVAPPEASCQDVNVATDTEDTPVQASIDNGSFDPDGDNLTLEQTPPGPYLSGETSVTLTATDSIGLTGSCNATVNVQVNPIPEIVSPSPGAPLPFGPVTFDMETNGIAVASWSLRLGTSPGGTDIFGGGIDGSITSVTVPTKKLPTDGSTIYARLRVIEEGSDSYNIFYEYTAALLDEVPQLTTPTPNTVLPSEMVGFTWSGANVDAWSLRAGSSPGTRDYYSSGGQVPEIRSLNVSGLPVDGSTVYFRFRYILGGRGYNTDYQYTAASGS